MCVCACVSHMDDDDVVVVVRDASKDLSLSYVRCVDLCNAEW